MCIRPRSRCNVSLSKHIHQAVRGNHFDDICRIKSQEPDAHERYLTGNIPRTSICRNSLQKPNPVNDVLPRTFPKHQTRSEEPTTNRPTITFLLSGTSPGRNAQNFVGRNQLCLACRLAVIIYVSTNSRRHTKTI